MAYLKGSKEAIQTYSDKCDVACNADGNIVQRWADIIAHPNGTDFAILKHPNVAGYGLTRLESLSEDWRGNEELI